VPFAEAKPLLRATAGNCAKYARSGTTSIERASSVACTDNGSSANFAEASSAPSFPMRAFVVALPLNPLSVERSAASRDVSTMRWVAAGFTVASITVTA
jgi:hypothetical protein